MNQNVTPPGGTIARLRMLARLRWAFVACAAGCALIAMIAAASQPSAQACQVITQIDPGAHCGGTPPLEMAAGIGAAVFLVLAVAVRIAASWQQAKITDTEGRQR